jgi:hypothetical protein
VLTLLAAFACCLPGSAAAVAAAALVVFRGPGDEFLLRMLVAIRVASSIIEKPCPV